MAVITGGSGDIGLATARRFAAEGATVVIGDVDETAGMRAADHVNGMFVKVHVTDQDQVDALFDTASPVTETASATSLISDTAPKGGVLALSRELGVQYARQGIRVNALCPGPVTTALLTQQAAADPEAAARQLVHVPLGRFAEPEEIAAAVAFLASDDSSFITASSLWVDGGISSAASR